MIKIPLGKHEYDVEIDIERQCYRFITKSEYTTGFIVFSIPFSFFGMKEQNEFMCNDIGG